MQAHRDRIAEMVAVTAEVMGTELSGAALCLFVDDLAPLSIDQIGHALARCRREIRGKNGFPPTLTIADVLERAGVVSESAIGDAECRAAWDAMLFYAGKYIASDPHGSYGPRHYFDTKTEIPDLEQRTADSLRRIGGWRVIKTMTEDDYPHVQRRFYEEHRAWRATEAALADKVLAGVSGFAALLTNKAMPGSPRLTAGSTETRSKNQSETAVVND